MNRLELVNEISKCTKMPVKQTDKFLTSFIDVVTKELKQGESVSLVGFGKWEVRKRAKRNCYNPHTKKVVSVPASTVPAFKPGKSLKMDVNKKK